MPPVQTKRLLLRLWKQEDLEPFAKLNKDPRVMEYFPSILRRKESDQMVERFQIKLKGGTPSFLAAALLDTGELIGMIGLNFLDPSTSTYPPYITSAIEVGWRLRFTHWGKGYATEGALACLKEGFEKRGLQEIISFTLPQNTRSRALMTRIGMDHDPKRDFDHPKVPEGNPLQKHVLYQTQSDQSMLQYGDSTE